MLALQILHQNLLVWFSFVFLALCTATLINIAFVVLWYTSHIVPEVTSFASLTLRQSEVLV